jgi:hypothetical protein
MSVGDTIVEYLKVRPLVPDRLIAPSDGSIHTAGVPRHFESSLSLSPASGRGAGSHTSATVRSAAGICPKGYGSQKTDISLPIITDVLT